MRIDVQLSKKEYLNGMRNQMSSFFSFGDERYTGIILGSFFWVTYHSGYEWNRMITNEKNRAFGFLKDSHGSTTVYCCCTRGFLDPISIPLLFLVSFALGSLLLLCMSLDGDLIDLREVWLSIVLLASVISTLVFSTATFFQDGLTERGCWGRNKLIALLHHPDDPEHNLRV